MAEACAICVLPSTTTNPLWRCRTSTHDFCHDCLGRYVQGRVEQGYSDMRCPCGECNYVFHDDDLLPLLPPKTAEHLGNLRLLHSSPRAVRCPECGTASEGNPKRPQMTCSKCSVQFCFHHGLDHPPGKCPRKRTPFRPIGRAKTWLWKKMRTQKCDNCGFQIERNGGCPHMTCRCGHEFCWYCKSTHPSHAWVAFPNPEEMFEDSLCNHWTVWACRSSTMPVLVGALIVFFPAALVVMCGYKIRQLARKNGSRNLDPASAPLNIHGRI